MCDAIRERVLEPNHPNTVATRAALKSRPSSSWPLAALAAAASAPPWGSDLYSSACTDRRAITRCVNVQDCYPRIQVRPAITPALSLRVGARSRNVKGRDSQKMPSNGKEVAVGRGWLVGTDSITWHGVQLGNDQPRARSSARACRNRDRNPVSDR